MLMNWQNRLYLVVSTLISSNPKILPHPCRILQRYTIDGGSNTHLSTFLKSPSNLAVDSFFWGWGGWVDG